MYIYIYIEWGATECPVDVFSNPHCLDKVTKQNECNRLQSLSSTIYSRSRKPTTLLTSSSVVNEIKAAAVVFPAATGNTCGAGFVHIETDWAQS